MVNPMRFRSVFLLIAALCVSQRSAAQDAFLPTPAAAPALETPLPISAPETPLYAPVTKPSLERPISWRRLVPNMVQDQRQIWLFPISVAHGHHLQPVLAVAGITAGLVALDE